jgi:GYF domain 2
MAPEPGPCGRMSAIQDDKNWFVLLRGKRYGPYTFAALAHAADRGVVDPEAGVWCLGWDEWRIARNVPGLFKPEPEPEPDDVGEEVDAFEEDADDREESRAEQEDVVDAEDRAEADDRNEEAAEQDEPDSAESGAERRSTESRSTEGRSAQSKTAEIKPQVALGRVSGGDLHARGPATDTADIKPAEGASLGLTAGPRMSMAEATPAPARNGGGVRLAILSVLACLVILFGTGWAAISLGIIRVEFMPAQSEARLPATSPPPASAAAPAAPVAPQTADATATPPTRGFADGVPDIVADMPAVAALKRADPDAYAKFVKRFAATYKANLADDEMLTRARTALRKSMKHLLAKASTESLLEITEVNLAYMRALQPVNPGSCVALSDESKGAAMETNLARDFAPLFQREMAVLERIIVNPGSTDAAPGEADVRPYLETVFNELKKQPVQTQLLGRDKLTAAEYAPYCELVIAFYEGVRALPFADAVKLLRNLYTAAAAESDTDKP